MSLEIRRVTSNRERRRFVDFPFRLYRGSPWWVPPFVADELKTLSPDRNPARDFCEAELWLALRGGEVVGRIAGIINRRANERWEQRRARFGWIDFVDDEEVSRTLLGTVESWAVERGLTELHGPIGFCDLDPEGMLIEGYEELANLGAIYNHPYYPEHLGRLGYEKDVDWIEYRLVIPGEVPKKLAQLRRIVESRVGVRIKTFSTRKEFTPYVRPVLELLNSAYQDLYGFVSLTERQQDSLVKTYFGMLRPEFVFVALDKDEQLAAFGITGPSLSRALQRARGRLFPFGWFHLLRALKHGKVLDLYLTAVRADLRGKGINALLIDQCNRIAIDGGRVIAETNHELETNDSVQGQWKFFEGRQHKRRRCFIKKLSRSRPVE